MIVRASIRRLFSSAPKRPSVPRTPIQWKHPEYYNEASFESEFRRVLDVCHGCRRCFNLCDAFPALFKAVDEAPTGELDSVPTESFAAVNDACTLCDMCFTAKCPYTPPHELNIDFPHLILRYRAIENGEANRAIAEASPGGLETGPWIDNAHTSTKTEVVPGVSRTLHKSPARAIHRVLANQDVTGPLSSKVAPLANAVTQAAPGSVVRKALEAVTKFDANAPLPSFASETFVSWFAKQPTSPAPQNGRKVVLYATCFVNHNRPAIGQAAVALLRASGVHVEVAFPGCCGMPQLEQGLTGDVSQRALAVAAELVPYVERGFSVVSLTASCTLMLKQEWPLLLRDDANVRRLADNTFEASEYLVALAKSDGLVRGAAPDALDASVTLHNACHARAQNIGFKARELLSLVPSLTVSISDRCSGHGGTWGFQKGHYDVAHRVGAPVVAAIVRNAKQQPAKPHYVVSECPLAADHLLDGLRKSDATVAATRCSPIELVARAYRLVQ